MRGVGNWRVVVRSWPVCQRAHNPGPPEVSPKALPQQVRCAQDHHHGRRRMALASRPLRASFCPRRRLARPSSVRTCLPPGCPPFQPELAALKAARLMLQQIDEPVRRRDSFAFETTLAGRGYARAIRRRQTLGYRVKPLFLSMPDANAAIARRRWRVRHGGHDIPEAVIRRRWSRRETLMYACPCRPSLVRLCAPDRLPRGRPCQGSSCGAASSPKSVRPCHNPTGRPDAGRRARRPHPKPASP